MSPAVTDGVATRLQAGRPGCRIQARATYFPLFEVVQTDGAQQRRVQWVPGSCPGIKGPGHYVDHSPPSSAEAENGWSYTSAPCTYLRGVNRAKCTFRRAKQPVSHLTES